VIDKEEGLPPALLGSCNDRAKQLHASPSGTWILWGNFIGLDGHKPFLFDF